MKKTIILLLFPILLMGQSYNVYFQSGIENIPNNEISFRSNLDFSQKEVINNSIYRYIQFEAIPNQEQLDELFKNGIQLYDYIPNYTYLAKIELGAIEQIKSIDFIRNILDLNPERKISQDILKGDVGDWALDGHVVKLMVKYVPDLAIEEAIKHLKSFGAEILLEAPDYNIIHISFPLENIYELAELSTITYYDVIPDVGRPEDTEGRALHRSNMINNKNPLGLKYDGSGISVMTRDDGLVGPHIDFHGRLDPTDSYGYLGIQHGDMVSGILAGAGNRDPQKKGMASGATLLIQNYADHFLNGVVDLHKDKNLVITNSSYSNGCNAGYTVITETVDNQLNTYPTMLHVFSAGNSNNRECGYGAGRQWGNITGGHKIAKNCIATANLDININIANTSSRGPASDGRLKPDIAARGVEQLSTAPNNGYQTGGGTSAASPGIAGVSAQLYQAYRELNNGDYPEAALIKSCMLNTADDLGNPGPDFIYGFGHVNALKAYNLLSEKRYIKDNVKDKEIKELSYQLDKAAMKFKIMLYWREKPGSVNASKALINDLDITVKTPDGKIFQPLVLDHTNDSTSLAQPATPGRDSVNNVEQVVIDNAQEGTYKIIVNGTTLPELDKDFIVLYEPIYDEIVVTYPSGEEHLEPGSKSQIHWDAIGDVGEFNLLYSIDNGNNWVFIESVSGNQRYYYWDVPEVMSGQCLFRVTRASLQGTSQFNFSIMTTPNNVRIGQICPNSLHISWDSIEGANKYYIYTLGDRFMEIVDSSETHEIDLNIQNPLKEQWFAVQAVGMNNAISERSIAINNPTNLVNCAQKIDIGISQLISPNALVFDCTSDYNNEIILELSNNGIEKASDIIVGFQVNGGTVIEESFMNELAVGEKSQFRFSNLPNLPEGEHALKVWCHLIGDNFSGNDTSYHSFEFESIEMTSANIDYLEGFESTTLPNGWIEDNDLMESLTRWEIVNNVLGREGGRSTAVKMYNYETQEVFYSDRLRSAPIDLKTAKNPVLKFDWVGASADVLTSIDYHDTLKVNIYSYCDKSSKVKVLELTKESLITVEMQGSFARTWRPARSSDWINIGVSLDEFIGDDIVIEFELVNGNRAQFYLDNVAVEESDVIFTQPDVVTSDTLCTRENGSVEVLNPDPDVTYKWIFSNAFLRTSAEGEGPHRVRYTRAGKYTIVLVLIKDGIRKEFEYPVEVFKKPAIKISSEEIAPNVVRFDNATIFATSYLWDFGDGTTSTEINPTHMYMENGLFEVVLTASNQCTTIMKSIEVEVGNVKTIDEIAGQQLILYPNPAKEVIHIQWRDSKPIFSDVSIYNINGSMIDKAISTLNIDDNKLSLSTAHLNEGIYLLSLTANGKTSLKRFIVQK